MKIKFKSLIALMITTLCLLLLLQVVLGSTINEQFAKIEQSEVQQIIGRIQAAIIDRCSQIDSEVGTLSQLNSTYKFVQDQNTEYEQTYLTVSSLSTFGVNFVIFLNNNGNFVTGMGLNLTTMQQASIPEDILAKISSDSLIWNLPSHDSHTYGFIITEEGPLMLSSKPILMTNGAGPSKGILVFARYFDFDEVKKLSSILNYPLSVQTIEDWKKENSMQEGTETAASYVKPLNETTIIGYDIVDDIRGQSLLAVGAIMPRTVYAQGLATISYLDQALIVAGVVFSITIILLMEYSVLRRLGKLTDSVTKLGKEEKQTQALSVSGNDEITWLALSINRLLAEIDSQSVKLRKSERLSAIGELARQTAHDLRNPLASLKMAAYYLKKKGKTCDDAEREKMLTIIENDVAHSEKILTDLIEYSSDVLLEEGECSPKTILTECLSGLKLPANIKVDDLTSASHKLKVDTDKISKVFTCIIKNAVEAMPEGGTLEVESCQFDSSVQIKFSDTGVGISEELLPKIFSPLITTKAQGMGLSLAICKRIVEGHGGKIEVKSVEGKGSVFKVTLPMHRMVYQDFEVLMAQPDSLLHY